MTAVGISILNGAPEQPNVEIPEGWLFPTWHYRIRICLKPPLTSYFLLLPPGSFPDAKFAKNLPEQIFGVEFSDHFANGIQSAAKLD